MTTYQPGDTANGHVLGSDGVWRPLAAPPPPVVVAQTSVPRTAAGTTIGCLAVPVVIVVGLVIMFVITSIGSVGVIAAANAEAEGSPVPVGVQVVLVLGLLGGFGGWYVWQRDKRKPTKKVPW